jgi:3-hydroxyacyl-[acyl-carrier-protein] dehydratase
MRFNNVDRIEKWEAGKSLTASRTLTLAEEYLGDHFPGFPVLPGVLMLQSLVEASAWLWRFTSDFGHSVIVLREVKNIKYGTFMQPGHTMTVQTEWVKTEGDLATFKGKGANEAGEQTVTAQFSLAAYSLKDRLKDGAERDQKLLAHWRERWNWLTRNS